MTRKRKLQGHSYIANKVQRRTSSNGACEFPRGHAIQHTLLHSYYPKVQTLRDFLLSRLPITSRARRRHVIAFHSASEDSKSQYLDTTLVGVLKDWSPMIQEARNRDYETFTQTQRSPARCSKENVAAVNIAEVLSFAVWLLFHKAPATTTRPNHILCHGFQRLSALKESDEDSDSELNVQGLFQQFPNPNISSFKSRPWTDILPLLGKYAEAILQSLLLDCGIFIHLSAGHHNFYQMSGIPLTDLTRVAAPSVGTTANLSTMKRPQMHKFCRTPGEISFVRSRILYAKPSLNGSREVAFGMQHIHVFNRYPDLANFEQTLHIMKYIFPRQYGLHNVFTSTITKKETVQPFKDYTLREGEIAELLNNHINSDTHACPRIPRRLRGAPVLLIVRIRNRHRACGYTQLLRYHCGVGSAALLREPVSGVAAERVLSGGSAGLVTQGSLGLSASLTTRASADCAPEELESPVMDHCTPAVQVSAFCQSVILHLLPRDALGIGVEGVQNTRRLLWHVNTFVRMRRVETFTLHQVNHRMKLTCIKWLRPPGTRSSSKMSRTDGDKRREILNEFVYFIFDSIVIPLIRTNFYVTESGVHSQRLFYFRHDVWRKISEPSLANSRLSTFEALQLKTHHHISASRALGYGQMRLMPKLKGIRNIVNLKRKPLTSTQGGSALGKSVNEQLRVVSEVLKYERKNQAAKLGASLFSVGEIHLKIKSFKRHLGSNGSGKLHFVKVDIRSCFDSIPQNQLVEVIEGLITEENYRIARHSETAIVNSRWSVADRKPTMKYLGRATSAVEPAAFDKSIAATLASGRKQTVFAETRTQYIQQAKHILRLLREHVQNNIVKVGKKYCRQRVGIPQGSVLSSLLCSFFYGAFEREQLFFIDDQTSLLLRVIDDFLLITIDEATAKRFMESMTEGNAVYGISVNPSKSLTNFEMNVGGGRVPRHHGTAWFPFCGMAINVNNLNISKYRERNTVCISDTLTIESSRRAGQTMRRRIQNSLKVQMHSMLLDTKHNSLIQVFVSIFRIFMECSIKFHSYCCGLEAEKRPSQTSIIDSITDLANLAFGLIRAKTRLKGISQLDCRVTRWQLCWLVAAAFDQVLRRKQTRYKEVLAWLSTYKAKARTATRTDIRVLDMVTEEGANAFRHCVF